MSWRSELKLADLPAGEALEIACPKCGAARYATAAELSAQKILGALDGETVRPRNRISRSGRSAIALPALRWAGALVAGVAGQDQRGGLP